MEFYSFEAKIAIRAPDEVLTSAAFRLQIARAIFIETEKYRCRFLAIAYFNVKAGSMRDV